MKNTPILLLVFGTLLLLSNVKCDENQLDPDERRQIIKSMLKSQKDIRKALFQIRRQIVNDGESPVNGEEGEDGGDDDGNYDRSSEESEESHREQQKKIREAREQLEAQVKEIADSFAEIYGLIKKIKGKIEEKIKNSNQINYNLHYRPHRRPSSHEESSGESGEKPAGATEVVTPGPAPLPTMPTEPTITEMPPGAQAVYRPTVPPIPWDVLKEQTRRRKRPHRKSDHESRSLEALRDE